MEVAILRPPLVYGPRAPGNFGTLARWIKRGLPLPLGRVTQNRRSLLYVGNLADALLRCASHPGASNSTFLVADSEVVSTAQLVEAIARAMGRQPNLWNVPRPWLDAAATWSGALRQLLDSLVVDTRRIRHELEWTPPYALEEGLAASFAHAGA
jgi:nucleoside-diphosphate-sugar epimerase